MTNPVGDPLIATGNETFDKIFTFTTLAVFGWVLYDVTHTLLTACKESTTWRKPNAPGYTARRRQVYLFLGLALAAFFVVNGLRIEFRRLKADVWDPIYEFSGKAGKVWQKPKEHVKIWNQLKAAGVKGRNENAVLTSLYDKLPWFENDWRTSDSVVSYFKMLVATSKRMWWTQQWIMGYTAWALFVGNEGMSLGFEVTAIDKTDTTLSVGRRRKLNPVSIMSFVLLAHLAGLASAQCLFFAFLSLSPISTTQKITFVPHPARTTLHFAVTAIDIAALPKLMETSYKNTSWFQVLHVFLFISPILVWTHASLDLKGSRKSARLDKACRAITYIWFSASVIAVAMHSYYTYQAYIEIHKDAHPIKVLAERWLWGAGLGQKNTMANARYLKSAIFSSLGDHAWANAYAFDVIFSVLSLCCWSAVGRLDVKDMIEGSVFPWVDETKAAVKHKIEDVRKTSGDLYHKLGRSPGSGKTSTIRRRSQRGLIEEAGDVGPDTSDGEPPRRRGRPAKITTVWSRSNSRVTSNNAGRSPTRSRSRSRARISPVKRSASRRSSSRLRSSVAAGKLENFEADDAHGNPGGTIADQAEAAGLTWGLFAVGGLGMASAAVFGAEELKI